jgi:hypothetical protein
VAASSIAASSKAALNPAIQMEMRIRIGWKEHSKHILASWISLASTFRNVRFALQENSVRRSIRWWNRECPLRTTTPRAVIRCALCQWCIFTQVKVLIRRMACLLLK